VPIGLEVARGGTKSPEIYLNFRDANLRQVLDAIVAKDGRYEWTLHNGVVNVTPRADRDVLLRDILDTKVREFSIKKGTNSFDLRLALANLPEVKRKLEEADVTAKISAFTNADSQDLKDLRLAITDTTFRDILNQIIKTSDLKYWIVNRDGAHGEYLILSF